MSDWKSGKTCIQKDTIVIYMRIAIITDGNNKLGLGHIYQTITLANLLLSEVNDNINISFLTKSDEIIIEMLQSTGCRVNRFDDDDAIFKALLTENPDRVIFDKLDVSPPLARKISEELSCKLLIFTNLTEANKYADVTLLADIGSNFKNIYERNTETGKVHIFGPKYWLLRPEFYDLKKQNKIHRNEVKDIMLMFGGSDHANLSSAVLETLLQMDSTFNILLVLGAAFEHHAELNTVISKNKNSTSIVTIAKNINNVGEIMYKHDVVFASPGLSFFESLAVGTPVLGFHQDDLQMKTYKEMLPTLDKSELYKLPSIIKNKSFIFPENPFISEMEIGEGRYDIINEILK